MSCTSPDGGTAQCCDGIDNDDPKDGRADFYGTKDMPSDPKCLYFTDTETETSPSKSDIIPCTDKCTLESVFILANNIIKFFFTKLLIPIFIVMLLYLAWQYFTSQGNINVHKKLLKQIKHLILGLLLILCAWLIVRTILDVVLDSNTEVGKGALQFFQ